MKKDPTLLLPLIVGGVFLFFSNLSAPDDKWAVPEGLPHQGGFAEGTPGLRVANALEWYFLNGAPGYWLLLLGLVLVAVLARARDRRNLFSSTVMGLGLLLFIACLEAPTVRHRCRSPRAACRGQLVSAGFALSGLIEEGKVEPKLELLSGSIEPLPTCPITGRRYRLESTPDGYRVSCTHPRLYSGNDLTFFGKSYLSLDTSHRTLTFSVDVDSLRESAP